MANISIAEQREEVKNKCSDCSCKSPKVVRVPTGERWSLIHNIMEGSTKEAVSILDAVGFPYGVKLKGYEGIFASNLDVKTFLNMSTAKPIIKIISQFGISGHTGYKVVWNPSLLEHPEGLSTETCEGAPKVISDSNTRTLTYCFTSCAQQRRHTTVFDRRWTPMYSAKTIVSVFVGLCSNIIERDDSVLQKAYRLVKQNPNYTKAVGSEVQKSNLIQATFTPQSEAPTPNTVTITTELFQQFIQTAVREALRELNGGNYNAGA